MLAQKQCFWGWKAQFLAEKLFFGKNLSFELPNLRIPWLGFWTLPWRVSYAQIGFIRLYVWDVYGGRIADACCNQWHRLSSHNPLGSCRHHLHVKAKLFRTLQHLPAYFASEHFHKAWTFTRPNHCWFQHCWIVHALVMCESHALCQFKFIQIQVPLSDLASSLNTKQSDIF